MALTTITSGGLGDNSVDTDQLAASAVETAKINNDAVSLAKMASGTDGAMLTYDADGNPVAITGTDGQVATSAGADAVSAFEAAGGGVSGVTSDGTDITITSGDIIFGAAGKGINLGVTSNTDSNTLDDYEEGTFTPLIIDTTGTPVVASHHASGQHGHYTKIGQTVFVSAFVETTAWSSPSGHVRIKGFPFTHRTDDNSDYQPFAVASFVGLNLAAAYSIHFRLDRGEVIGSLSAADTTGGVTALAVGEWTAAGGQVGVSGFYRVA
jgi:hypothetical protein